tara:strand:+ start:7218 stop:7682 length:465 start_codon:yes stop_codon:yes gene_type:complete
MNENRVLKRLGKEYEKLLKSNKKIVSFMSNMNEIIIEINYTSKLCLRIVIDDTYPFSSPHVYINNIEYCKYIQSQISLLDGLTTQMNIPCPCCYNIINIWSPGYYLINIVDEFEDTIKLTNLFHKLNYVKKYLISNFEKSDSIFIIHLIYNYLE